MNVILEKKIKHIYKALVMKVKKKKVLIDARLKCLYYVPIGDFTTDELKDLSGKQIDVYIKNIDPVTNPNKTASYRRAKQEIIWSEILNIYKNKQLIEGKIHAITKGGYAVYLSIGFYAFLPISQICEDEVTRYKPDNDELFSFYIVNLNRLNFNIVLSRKEVIRQNVADLNQSSIDTINIGAALFGIIKGISAQGLFVYINNDYTGFVPIDEAGHGNNLDLQKMFYSGQRIEAIATDIQENKIVLSIKKYQPNPILEFTRNQKVDVIVNRFVVDNEEITLFGHLASNPHIFCRIMKEDKIITIEEINQIIETKSEMVVTVKAINEESYSLICTTKKSQKEIWNNFMLNVQANNFIVEGRVINKSKYMLFLSYMEREIYVPITQVSFFNSKSKFDALQPGDKVRVYIIHLDKRNQEAIGSIKRLEILEDNMLKTKMDNIIKSGTVDAVLEYVIESSHIAILKIQDDIEQSLPYSKLGQCLQNLKSNPNVPIKLQIYHSDEFGTLDLGPSSDNVIKSNVKTKKFNISDIITQFKVEQTSSEE